MALTDRRAKTPIDLDGEDDVPDLPGSLASWAQLVLEERGIDASRVGVDVTSSARVLRRERMWIAAQPWLDDYVTELAALHRAVALTVCDTMWPKSIGKCPNCTAPMYPTIGVDSATCRKCRTTWTGIALSRLRLIHEQEGAR
jgi:hypothetical protein